MLSLDQIKKLQKKIAPKVDAKIAAIRIEEANKAAEDLLQKQIKFENEILPQLKLIRNTCSKLQDMNPTRGACLCIWDNKVYEVKDNKAIINRMFSSADILSSVENGNFECIKKCPDGKSYYMLNLKVAETEKKIHDWFQEHYATLKFVTTKIKNSEGFKAKNMTDLSILGSLSMEFTEKFPGKTPSDLIEYIKLFDELIIADLKKIEKESLKDNKK